MPKQVRRAAAENMTKQEFEKQVMEIFETTKIKFIYKETGFHKLEIEKPIIWFAALQLLNKLVNVQYITPIETSEKIIQEITIWNNDLKLEGI